MTSIRFAIPGYVTDFLQRGGYVCPCSSMALYIQSWDELYRAEGDFWDYQERASKGVAYRVHRRSIHPAKRVCDEWASLQLTDKTDIATKDEACTTWLREELARLNFVDYGVDLISRTFALGTGAWVLSVDMEREQMQLRRYDARQIIPLEWDDDGIRECAFVSRCVYGGQPLTQLQLHTKLDGIYLVQTRFFDDSGKIVSVDGVLNELSTGADVPWFAILKPAIPNIYVDGSPYGQSVFAEAIDIMQSVDLCYDAIFNEVDLSKMRVFLSDLLLEREDSSDGVRIIPFGKSDCTLYRSVSTMNEDLIREFAPALRTGSQLEAYRLALKTMGDVCGFGLNYFDIDERSGGVKTATEVSAENSQLMRNIKRHEALLGVAVRGVSKAVLQCGRDVLGLPLPDEGRIRVSFDDSIISDTAAEKAQDLAEVGVTMNAWEYRVKWYGEDEETAKARVPKSGVDLNLEEFLNA